jgi:hypothetical protein
MTINGPFLTNLNRHPELDYDYYHKHILNYIQQLQDLPIYEE